MSVTLMVGWLGVAVALLSHHAQANAWVAAVVGMAAVGHVTQQAQLVTVRQGSGRTPWIKQTFVYSGGLAAALICSNTVSPHLTCSLKRA